MVFKESEYTYEKLLDEARNAILTSKQALYIHLMFLKARTWINLEDLMTKYSSDKRRAWVVNIIGTPQQDFFIIQFANKENPEDKHYFYWKIWKEDATYVTILSFSIEKFRFIKSCLKSLVYSTKGMWFAWVDSRLLENFDDFASSVFGDTEFKIERVIGELRPVGGIGKPAVEVRWAIKDKEELMKRKRLEYEDFKRISYIKRLRCILRKGQYIFKTSVSDEGEIFLEQGDLFAFIDLVHPLIESITKVRDAFRKRLDIKTAEVRVRERTFHLKSIELLEVLALETKEPTTVDWFENLTKVFSAPYLEEERLVNFALMKGNPYFLAHVIDLENGSAVYLSATANEVRISPASEETNIATISKIVRTLQKYVDPTLIPQLV